MELVDQKLGNSGEVKVKIENAQLQVVAALNLSVLAGPVLDKIAELIPGHFEDGLIQEAKDKIAALGAGA